MSLIDQARSIPRGVETIVEWLGDNATVVEKEEAQRRADICLKCVRNIDGSGLVGLATNAVSKYVELKNKLKLRVNGERMLDTCGVCSCKLRLLIWLPKDKVTAHIPDEELKQYPEHCWKL